MAAPPTIRLVPFEPELLLRVLPWFDHPEVQRRLGGRSWPERELVLRNAARGEEFRGRRVLRSHTFVAMDDAGAPAAQIGGDVYDRWTLWDPATERVVRADRHRTMGAAYVVDPQRLGEGHGQAPLRAVVAADQPGHAVSVGGAREAGRRRAVRAGHRAEQRGQPGSGPRCRVPAADHRAGRR